MGPRCSSAETQVCHRSYIIAAMYDSVLILLLSYGHHDWFNKVFLFLFSILNSGCTRLACALQHQNQTLPLYPNEPPPFLMTLLFIESREWINTFFPCIDVGWCDFRFWQVFICIVQGVLISLVHI